MGTRCSLKIWQRPTLYSRCAIVPKLERTLHARCGVDRVRINRVANKPGILGGLSIELMVEFRSTAASLFMAEDQSLGSADRFGCQPMESFGGWPRENELADGTPVEHLGNKFSEP